MTKLIAVHGYRELSKNDPSTLLADISIEINGGVVRVPFVYKADDTSEVSIAISNDLATNNPVIEPADEPTTVLPVEADYTKAIQAMLDQAAIERRYTSGDTMATYVNSTNATWAAEAQAFVQWRDAVWLYAYAQLDAVMAGEREQPTIEELLAELPEPTWPA